MSFLEVPNQHSVYIWYLSKFFLVEVRAGLMEFWYYYIMYPKIISKPYGYFFSGFDCSSHLFISDTREKIIMSWRFMSQIDFKNQDAIWSDHPIIVVSKMRLRLLPINLPIKFSAMSMLWIRLPDFPFVHDVTLSRFLAIVWLLFFLSFLKRCADDI